MLSYLNREIIRNLYLSIYVYLFITFFSIIIVIIVNFYFENKRKKFLRQVEEFNYPTELDIILDEYEKRTNPSVYFDFIFWLKSCE